MDAIAKTWVEHREHVLGAHEAAVEQRKARHDHQQDEAVEETSIQAVSPLSGPAPAGGRILGEGQDRGERARPARRRAAARVKGNFIGLVLRKKARSRIRRASPSISPVRMRTAFSSGMTKILPSPIWPVRAGAGDRLDHAGHQVGRDRDLDLELRQEAHRVLGAAVDLGMSLLAPVALHFRDGQAVHAQAGERVAHLLELERLDDGHDDFHEDLAPDTAPPLARAGDGCA